MPAALLFAAAMAAAALTGRERYPGPGAAMPEEALPRAAFWMPAVWFGVPMIGFLFLPLAHWALVVCAIAALWALAPPLALGDRTRAAEVAAALLSALFLITIILTAGPT